MKGKETKLLTVGRLAERTGVSPDTLRYYEKMGLIRRREAEVEYYNG